MRRVEPAPPHPGSLHPLAGSRQRRLGRNHHPAPHSLDLCLRRVPPIGKQHRTPAEQHQRRTRPRKAAQIANVRQMRHQQPIHPSRLRSRCRSLLPCLQIHLRTHLLDSTQLRPTSGAPDRHNPLSWNHDRFLARPAFALYPAQIPHRHGRHRCGVSPLCWRDSPSRNRYRPPQLSPSQIFPAPFTAIASYNSATFTSTSSPNPTSSNESSATPTPSRQTWFFSQETSSPAALFHSSQSVPRPIAAAKFSARSPRPCATPFLAITT